MAPSKSGACLSYDPRAIVIRGFVKRVPPIFLMQKLIDL